ncbi:MAG TPA: ABC transporter ATP-binding protein [Phycisphaerae bacterium]|jgi:putative ABC transport system ATP-binding protein
MQYLRRESNRIRGPREVAERLDLTLPCPDASGVIELDAVEKVYETGRKRTVALAGVSLRIAPGEYVAVMGPSGSGKSTLLHLAGALDLPTAGQVRINGRSTTEMSDDERAMARRMEIGFVFQFFNLLPTLTLEQNVALPMLLAGHRLRSSRSQVSALLERVGLGARHSALPDELSGGEMQRAAIARALVAEPEMILADEPTGNLDSGTGQEIIRLFGELAQHNGRTVVIVTHDAAVAAHAQRVIRLRDGQVESDRSS